jgi:xanthine/uracil permease
MILIFGARAILLIAALLVRDIPHTISAGRWEQRMTAAHLILAFVCLVTAIFAWQIRKEQDKLLYFMLGIGVGCAMMVLIT